jgi:hypothetical protein
MKNSDEAITLTEGIAVTVLTTIKLKFYGKAV